MSHCDKRLTWGISRHSLLNPFSQNEHLLSEVSSDHCCSVSYFNLSQVIWMGFSQASSICTDQYRFQPSSLWSHWSSCHLPLVCRCSTIPAVQSVLALQGLRPWAEVVISISVHQPPDSHLSGSRAFHVQPLLMVTLCSYALASPVSKLLSVWRVPLSHWGQFAIIDVWLLDTETDVLWSIYGRVEEGGGHRSLLPCMGQLTHLWHILVFQFTWHALLFFRQSLKCNAEWETNTMFDTFTH